MIVVNIRNFDPEMSLKENIGFCDTLCEIPKDDSPVEHRILSSRRFQMTIQVCKE